MFATNATPKLIMKLNKIVDDVKEYSSKIDGVSSKYIWGSDQYGVNFINRDGKAILWFGIWYPFWEKHLKPLCFGFDVKNSPENIINKFKELYTNKTINYEFEGENLILSWVNKDDLSGDCLGYITKEIEWLLINLLEVYQNKEG